MAKIHLLALTVALLASACALAEETDVYLLIGQSNMAGRPFDPQTLIRVGGPRIREFCKKGK